MSLSWQPLGELFVEPAGRRLRVRFGGEWIADSERAVVLSEPGRPPVPYFPAPDVRFDLLEFRPLLTRHPDLGLTAWYAIRVGNRVAEQAAWHHLEAPVHAAEFADLIAFSGDAVEEFRGEGTQRWR